MSSESIVTFGMHWKRFYREWIRVGFRPVFLAVEIIELVLLVVGAVLVGRPDIEAWAKPYVLLVPLALLVATLLIGLGRAPYILYRALGHLHDETRGELSRLLERRLAITFGHGPPFEQFGPGLYHGFRVAVEAVGGASIEEVHVEVVKIDPPENAYVPFVLHLKGNDPPQEPKYRFDLHPGEREYVDVVWNFGDASNPRFYFYMADREKPSEMPAKPYEYTITVAAYGRDVVEPAVALFSLLVDQKGILHFGPNPLVILEGRVGEAGPSAA